VNSISLRLRASSCFCFFWVRLASFSLSDYSAVDARYSKCTSSFSNFCSISLSLSRIVWSIAILVLALTVGSFGLLFDTVLDYSPCSLLWSPLTSSNRSYMVCLNMKKSKRAASIRSFLSYSSILVFYRGLVLELSPPDLFANFFACLVSFKYEALRSPDRASLADAAVVFLTFVDVLFLLKSKGFLFRLLFVSGSMPSITSASSFGIVGTLFVLLEFFSFLSG